MNITSRELRNALLAWCPVLLVLSFTWAQDAVQANKPATRVNLATNVRVNSAANTRTTTIMRSDFVIGNQDVLAVDVWKEAEISRAVTVRSDGKISLPLIGEVQASGKTPKQLEAEITNGLQAFMSDPEVTVIVQEIRSQTFNILGYVQRPGAYPLSVPMTVVDAIAVAGGFRDFAKMKNIYVLRNTSNGKQIRIPFNYKDVIRGKKAQQNVTLEPRDTIVVP